MTHPKQIFIIAATLTIAIATFGFAAANAEAPEAGAVPDGAELYSTRTCVACHGKDANTPLLPSYPKLAGQNSEYLFQQMKDIKSGARANGQTPAMRGVMHLVDESEMQVLADFLSKMAPAPAQTNP